MRRWVLAVGAAVLVVAGAVWWWTARSDESEQADALQAIEGVESVAACAPARCEVTLDDELDAAQLDRSFSDVKALLATELFEQFEGDVAARLGPVDFTIGRDDRIEDLAPALTTMASADALANADVVVDAESDSLAVSTVRPLPTARALLTRFGQAGLAEPFDVVDVSGGPSDGRHLRFGGKPGDWLNQLDRFEGLVEATDAPKWHGEFWTGGEKILLFVADPSDERAAEEAIVDVFGHDVTFGVQVLD